MFAISQFRAVGTVAAVGCQRFCWVVGLLIVEVLGMDAQHMGSIGTISFLHDAQHWCSNGTRTGDRKPHRGMIGIDGTTSNDAVRLGRLLCTSSLSL